MKRIALGIGAILLIALVILGFDKWRKNRVPFEMFFSTSTIPQSVRWVASGKKRPLIGGGTYVLVFSIPRNGVQTLATNNGFVAVNINDDPNHWRLDLCNWILRDLVSTNIVITSQFEAYANGWPSNVNFARLFYDTNQELAVVIGRGTFLRPNGHTRY